MRKKPVAIRLDEDKIEYLEYIASRCIPVGPNKSKAVELLIDLVQSNFSEDMIVMHAQVMKWYNGHQASSTGKHPATTPIRVQTSSPQVPMEESG